MNNRSGHSTGGLLGWERFRLFGRPAVRSASGVGSLFAEEVDDLRPTWPKQPGKQQKQVHFDFQMDDVAEMVKKAEALGHKRQRRSSADGILRPCRARRGTPFACAGRDGPGSTI